MSCHAGTVESTHLPHIMFKLSMHTKPLTPSILLFATLAVTFRSEPKRRPNSEAQRCTK